MSDIERIVDNDEAIINTNDEASQCKRFAAFKGYYNDPFLEYFCKLPHTKPPEINMGYYIRVFVMNALIDHFIDTFKSESQIINLGAGFDTTYWQLMKKGKKFRKFVEIDLAPVVYKKAHIISHNLSLQKYFNNIIEIPNFKSKEKNHVIKSPCVSHHRNSVTSIDHEIFSQNYDLICADLRDIDLLNEKIDFIYSSLPDDHKLDYNKPTLIIAECVLVYMGKQETDKLLKWLTSKFKSTISFINYEQVNIGDQFGSVMMKNFKSQGCYLLGAKQCLNEDSQKNRFLDNNWDSAQVGSILKIFYSMDNFEKHRILNVEFLDEKELLYQLLEHYCLCWACKNINYQITPDFNINIESIIKNYKFI